MRACSAFGVAGHEFAAPELSVSGAVKVLRVIRIDKLAAGLSKWRGFTATAWAAGLFSTMHVIRWAS